MVVFQHFYSISTEISLKKCIHDFKMLLTKIKCKTKKYYDFSCFRLLAVFEFGAGAILAAFSAIKFFHT